MSRLMQREFKNYIERGEKFTGYNDDALGLLRGRARKDLNRHLDNRPNKKANYIAPPNFRMPVARSHRLSTPDGRTSFHFSHEAITKTKRATESDSGLKNRPGAAKAHNDYIERDGAVARVQAEQISGDGLERDPADAKVDGDDADRKKEGAGYGIYMERQEALAERDDGTKVLFTNISDDPKERAEVWNLIEEHETEPGQDKMTIQTGRDPEFWERVRGDKQCPLDLSDAIAIADPSLPYRFETESNLEIRRFLRSQEGWDDVRSRTTFNDGRGGRVQYRLIGELPHELSDPERASILKEFTKKFEERKLPYVAVMHAPDHTNDARNWHFHLAYYDRPISKMEDGQWDFAISEERRDKHRNKWTCYPHRQAKERLCNRPEWLVGLRKRLAEITNDHLEAGKIDRRLDPRKYSEMGIHVSGPQKHLGTKLANMEAMGIPTPTGVENEWRQWDAERTSMQSDLTGRQRKMDEQTKRWNKRLDEQDLNEFAKAALRKKIAEWKQYTEEADKLSFWGRRVERDCERHLSRAKKTIEACEAELKSDPQGKAYLIRKRPHLQERRRQAEAFYRQTQNELRDDFDFVIECRVDADKAKKAADTRRKQIEARLGVDDFMLSENRRQIEHRVPRKPAQRSRYAGLAAIPKPEIDAFVDSIRQDHRRLVKTDDGIVVPAKMQENEDRFFNAGNTPQLLKRLEGIKKQQDKLIGDVAAFIDKTPGAVRQHSRDGNLILVTKRPAWRAAFLDYQDDPVLQKAATRALERNAQAATANTKDVPSQKAPRPEAPKTGGQAPERPSTPRPANDVEPAIERIRTGRIRLHMVDGKLAPAPAALQRLSVAADDLSTPSVQKRLAGIQRTQERELKRLSAYTAKFPQKIAQTENGFVLDPSAPKELREIAQQWSADETLQREIKSRFAAHAAASESARSKAAAPPAPSSEKAAPVSRPAASEPAKTAPSAPEKPKAPEPSREPLREKIGEHTVIKVKPGARGPSKEQIKRALSGKTYVNHGLHPKIDAWIKSHNDSRPEKERNANAAAVMKDRDAAKLVAAMEPRVAQHLRHENARYHKLRQQQLSLGLEPDEIER